MWLFCKQLRSWSRDAVDCFRGGLPAAERLSGKNYSDTVRHLPHSAGSHQTDRHTSKTSHHHRTWSWISVWHSSWNCRLTTDAARRYRYVRCSFYRQNRRHRCSAILKWHNRAAQRCDDESQEHSFEHRTNQRLPWDLSQQASSRYERPLCLPDITCLDIWLAVHHSITLFIITNLIHKFLVHSHKLHKIKFL